MDLNKVSKIFIYFLVFLLPIFFLPFFQNVLDFPKQMLLSIFISLSALFYLAQTFKEGKIKIFSHPFNIILILLLLSSFFSLLFSKSKFQSLFGIPLSFSSSFFTLTFLTIFFFLLINLFGKEEIFNLQICFSLSLFLLLIFSFCQIFGKYILPFNFSRTKTFTLLGTVYSLSTLLACFLPFFIIAFSLSGKFLKFFFLFFVLLSLIFLSIVNHSISWILLIFGCAILLSLLLIKRKIFNFQALILCALSLSLAIFFLTLNVKIFPLIPEVFLDQKTSFEIAIKSIQERPVLGSGPATFLFQFAKHKPKSINETPFWNIRFAFPASRFLDYLSTQGILGTILFLLFLLSPIYFSFKKESTFVFLPSLFSFILFHFLYPLNLTQLFAYFLLLSFIFKLIYEKEREIDFTGGEKYFSLFSSFSLILIFILLLGNLIFTFQVLTGEFFYFKGVESWQRGDREKAISYLERAQRINPRITQYLRDLSQLYLSRATEKIQKGERNVETDIFAALDLAKKATEKEKENVLNWSVRAFTYQSLLGIASGAEDWAIKCWQKSIDLEPQNPYFWTQKGIVHLRKGILGQEKEKNFEEAEKCFQRAIEAKSDYAPAHFQMAMLYQAKGELEKAISKLKETKTFAPFDVGLAFQLGVLYYQKGDYEKAKEELESAVTQSPNYANALYFLGLTYDKLGDKEKALEKFEKVAKLNPDVEEVKKIIENLKQGKEALEGILQKVPPQTPIEEKPSEIKE